MLVSTKELHKSTVVLEFRNTGVEPVDTSPLPW